MTYQKPIVTSVTVLNVMLGTGPIIIPSVFLIGGYQIATLFIVAMGVIAMITSLFAVEALSIANALKHYRSTRLQSECTENMKQIPINSSLVHGVVSPDQTVEHEKFISQSSYAIQDLLEFSQIAELIIGPKMKGFLVLSISFYLSGVISSKTIISSKILQETFEDVNYLNNYYLWLGLFFFISAVSSFKDVTSTRTL